jgi:hypothetical protein
MRRCFSPCFSQGLRVFVQTADAFSTDTYLQQVQLQQGRELELLPLELGAGAHTAFSCVVRQQWI